MIGDCAELLLPLMMLLRRPPILYLRAILRRVCVLHFFELRLFLFNRWRSSLTEKKKKKKHLSKCQGVGSFRDVPNFDWIGSWPREKQKDTAVRRALRRRF